MTYILNYMCMAAHIFIEGCRLSALDVYFDSATFNRCWYKVHVLDNTRQGAPVPS